MIGRHSIRTCLFAAVTSLILAMAASGQERAAEEVTHLRGVRIAPDVAVANPAFDVTPARLISAIICERGVARLPYAESLRQLAESVSNATHGLSR